MRGRPRIGTELKTPKDYTYDYPTNREIAKDLVYGDRQTIANHTGFSRKYIDQWCAGIRRSQKIEQAAKQLVKFNIAKRKLLSSPK